MLVNVMDELQSNVMINVKSEGACAPSGPPKMTPMIYCEDGTLHLGMNHENACMHVMLILFDLY